MASLGKNFVELGRGYEKVSENYLRTYLTGVNINDTDKPFVVAMGDRDGDSGATVISLDELLSDKWRNHIKISGCEPLIERLKVELKEGKPFPQPCILNSIKQNNE